MSQITRCPHCATTFKVVADQLRISDGWVRCGQCKEVFDATEHLLVSEPQSLLPEMLLPAPQPPAQPAAHTPDGVHVWGSAREAVPIADADAEPRAMAVRMHVDAEDAAGLPADSAGGNAPIPLSSLLKQESPAQLQEEIPGYELPAAAQADSDWPQEVQQRAPVDQDASRARAIPAGAGGRRCQR
ncbi:MAG TPA: zinc-ribbon domain-containing protein [Alicycliphilus sp.]|nr:zinc-ribbon domain-containing protein [Alicycliphilus sp.]